MTNRVQKIGLPSVISANEHIEPRLQFKVQLFERAEILDFDRS
jgi:hypothetical protein